MLEFMARQGVRYANALRGVGHAYSIRQEVRSVLRYVTARDDLVMLDVGADVGLYTTEFVRLRKGFSGRCFLFEPNPVSARRLQQTKFSASVEVIESALGSTEGTLTLHRYAPANAISSLYDRRLDHIGVRLAEAAPVRVSTVDAFCRERGLERIDFMKLDVEGHELEVLRGASQMIERGCINVIQFEFGGCNLDSRTYFQDFWYLLNERFCFRRIVPFGKPVVVSRYTEDLEQFTTTNYILTKKQGLPAA